MNVLVTGGGGFIGSHLVARARSTAATTSASSTTSPPAGARTSPALADDVELVEGDIQSYERAHNAVRGCEVVFHQAALPSVPRSVQDPLTSNATNVIGTLNVLLAARDAGVRRVVFASSSSVYGATPELPKREDDAGAARSRPTPSAKLAGEGYCRASAHGLRPRDRRAALLQRLRPAPGPARRSTRR